MNVLAVLIPISLILGGLGLAAFIWTVRSQQYDDDSGNAARILLDDDWSERAEDSSGGRDERGPQAAR